MTVRLGVVGTGSIGTVHLENADSTDGLTVEAVADVDLEAARAVGEPRDASIYEDGVELIEHEEGLDAALIAVPPFAHPKHEEAAAERGLDVLIEKPVGLTSEQVEATGEVIESADILTAAGYVCRYAAVTDRLLEVLEGRTIGSIESTYWAPVTASDWWKRREQSGGQLVEQATHPYDLHRYLAGEVDSLVGTGTDRRLTDQIDFHDASSVTMRHESGVVGHVGATCGASSFRFETRIVAEDAQLTVDYIDHEIEGLVDGSPLEYEGDDDWYRRELAAFVDAVERESAGPIRSDYADAASTLELTLAATEAIETDEAIEL